MNADASNLRTAARAPPLRDAAEHRFYVGFAILCAAALLLGFARTFFLRPWLPEHVAAHAPPEPIFLLHGAVSALWFVLLIVQPSLVAAGRIKTHRRLGVAGAVLAAIIFVVGMVGSLIAARRGFIGVSGSSLEFLAIPVTALTMFGAFRRAGDHQSPRSPEPQALHAARVDQRARSRRRALAVRYHRCAIGDPELRHGQRVPRPVPGADRGVGSRVAPGRSPSASEAMDGRERPAVASGDVVGRARDYCGAAGAVDDGAVASVAGRRGVGVRAFGVNQISSKSPATARTSSHS
jgi:hypothetical protein